MPAIIFFACLDLEQKTSFLDGHYLRDVRYNHSASLCFSSLNETFSYEGIAQKERAVSPVLQSRNPRKSSLLLQWFVSAGMIRSCIKNLKIHTPFGHTAIHGSTLISFVFSHFFESVLERRTP